MPEQLPSAIRIRAAQLELLDQRALPHRVDYLAVHRLDDAIGAIASLAVRGAPAIGIAAAYALAQSLRDVPATQFAERLREHGQRLIAARPTAVNLAWAVHRLLRRGAAEPSAAALWREAEDIHQEDRAICRGIGEQGLGLLDGVRNLLTHCNAGAMAVSEWGTATAPIYLAAARGQTLHVYVDETRPLLQGARITAWEMARAGIPHTLICDNAAASLMAAGRVDCVLVGTDRVTRNGDVVNKIGTLNLAVLCRHFRIPFYVACPSSTFDPDTPDGAAVVIEQRAAAEVLGDLPATTPVYNPAFDVTPATLVSAIITERGVAYPPLDAALAALLT